MTKSLVINQRTLSTTSPSIVKKIYTTVCSHNFAVARRVNLRVKAIIIIFAITAIISKNREVFNHTT